MPVTQHNARDLLVEAIDRVLLDQEPTARKYRRWLQRIADEQGFLDIQLLLPGQEISKATQGVYLRYGEHLAKVLDSAPLAHSKLSTFKDAFESPQSLTAQHIRRYSLHYNPFDQLGQTEMHQLSLTLKKVFSVSETQAGAKIKLFDPAKPAQLSSHADMMHAGRTALALLTLAAEFGAGPEWELTTYGHPTRNFKFPDPPAEQQDGADDSDDDGPRADRPQG